MIRNLCVRAGDFKSDGCSFESRARYAAAANATGLLYLGNLHSPFDWDGTSHAGLPPASILFESVYRCFAEALLIDGHTTDDGALVGRLEAIESTRTPLEEAWYFSLCLSLTLVNAIMMLGYRRSPCRTIHVPPCPRLRLIA